MGGAYIECGNFSGSDKSGKPIYELFDDISNSLPLNQQSEWNEIVRQITCDDTDNVMFRISKSVSPAFVPFVRNYVEEMSRRYLEKYDGFSDPFEAMLEDISKTNENGRYNSEPHDMDKYVCANDLLQACQVCLKTGEDVIVFHDYFP